MTEYLKIRKDGISFVHPKEPFSTNGQPEMISCDEGTVNQTCTHIKKIPLYSIVELRPGFQLIGSISIKATVQGEKKTLYSLTSFNTEQDDYFYHFIHMHGMEFYVMATGRGDYPTTSNSAFKCLSGKTLNCHR